MKTNTTANEKKLGSKGVKALARRYSHSDWQKICGDVRGWGLANMTAAVADVICHRILLGDL